MNQPPAGGASIGTAFGRAFRLRIDPPGRAGAALGMARSGYKLARPERLDEALALVRCGGPIYSSTAHTSFQRDVSQFADPVVSSQQLRGG